MKQRLSIARAFAFPSEILLMDEPFSSLDINLKNSVIDSFKKLWLKNNKTVIFITHDIDEAVMLSDTIYLIDENPVKLRFTKIINDNLTERVVTDVKYLSLIHI